MKTIWFLDDSEFERQAFVEVFRDLYHIVAVERVDQFPEARPDLILVDLYFRRRQPREPPPKGVVRPDTSSIEKTLGRIQRMERNSQMAEAADLRQHAERLLEKFLKELEEEPDEGLLTFDNLHRRHASVPAAFLSRKCQRKDIPLCMARGALTVVLKPPLDVEDGDLTPRATQGWKAVKQEASKLFDVLMKGAAEDQEPFLVLPYMLRP